MNPADRRRLGQLLRAGALSAAAALLAIAGLLGGVLVLERYDCERCRARRRNARPT